MKTSKMTPARRLNRALALAICLAAVISIVQCSSPPVEAPKEAAKTSEPAELRPKEEKPAIEAKSVVEPAKVGEQAKAPDSGEQTRKGRADAPQAAAGPSSEPDQKPAAASGQSAPAEPASKPAPKPASGSNSTSAASQAKLTGKSGSSPSGGGTSKKLPANLGTVTSTGSGGPTQYVAAKQDAYSAYSAIAEKHGALESSVKRADKRNHMQRFGGIQKAGGFGDSLNPFKSVTDGGLARTLGASMRSIMKGKYSIPAYVASAVLGAVALMAFYESPISPLPVPALPEPPVGRFPPEMPVISPNLAVPFRMNQQQQQQQYGNQQYGGQQNGYSNQRSFQAGGPMPNGLNQQQQPTQQVLFPGATAQSVQQRQGLTAGPVQQLAANLISSVSGKQTAQRKSGLDLEPDSSRSFLGASKLSLPANQNKQQAGSILSFLGLGGANAAAAAGPQQPIGAGPTHRASGMGGPHMSGSNHDQVSNSLSNSHLVNKMKSYFDRPVPHQSWSMDHNVPNQYDQYRRMSIMQALVKDTSFLSSYFSPSRRNSNVTSPASSLQQSISAVLNGNANQVPPPAASQQVASSRMQVDPVLPSLIAAPFSGSPASNPNNAGQQPAQPKRASSGLGLMRAALETLTSGLLHRNAESGPKKTLDEQSRQQQQNALASSVSLLSDIMSSYNAAQQQANSQQQQQQQYQPTVQQADSSKQQQAQASAAGNQVGHSDQAGARSADSASPGENSSASPEQPPVKPVSSSSGAQAEPEPSQQPLNRKVRSIGLEYQTGEPQHQNQNQQNHQQQQQQQQQQQSRASQINNLVDLVSDSYKQNKYLFNFVMNQAGLSQALPYVEQFLDAPSESRRN